MRSPQPSSSTTQSTKPATAPANHQPGVILISGLGDTQATWFNQVPAFTDAGYTVLTFDNRGAVAVPKPYHVLGVSMGGMIAQSYALDGVAEGNEAELASVIPACTSAAIGLYGSRFFAVLRRIACSMSVAEAMRAVTLSCWTPEFLMKPENQLMLDEMDRDLDKMDDEVEGMGLSSFLAQMNAVVAFDSREELLRSQLGSKTKVLIIAGEQDLVVPISLSHNLHTLIEGSRWRPIKGGHACKLEFPNAFNRACMDAWKEAEEGSR